MHPQWQFCWWRRKESNDIELIWTFFHLIFLIYHDPFSLIFFVDLALFWVDLTLFQLNIILSFLLKLISSFSGVDLTLFCVDLFLFAKWISSLLRLISSLFIVGISPLSPQLPHLILCLFVFAFGGGEVDARLCIRKGLQKQYYTSSPARFWNFTILVEKIPSDMFIDVHRYVHKYVFLACF